MAELQSQINNEEDEKENQQEVVVGDSNNLGKKIVDEAYTEDKKLSVEEDYNLGKDTGTFVYPENQERYLNEKSPEIKVNPTANLSSPRTKALIQQDIQKQKQEETATYDKLISGEMTEVGGTKVNLITRNLAKEGHVPSIIKLEKLANSVKSKPSDVKIGGVRNGKILSTFTGLSEDQVTDLTGYATGRMKVLNALKEIDPVTNEPRVDDPIVQQLLVDYFSTGNFHTEMTRRLADAGRGAALLPVLAHMGYHLVGAATDAIDDPFYFRSKVMDEEVEDETFLDSWEKRIPSMAKFFEQYKSTIENVLPGATAASAMNEDIKKIYIDLYGKDAFEAEYTIPNPATGKRMEVPIISEELGNRLMKVGFEELPVVERMATIIVENVGAGSIIGKAHLAAGKKYKKDADEIRSSAPEKYKRMEDIDVLRTFNIENAQTEFTKAWYKSTANIGRKLKSRGKVAAAQVDIDRNTAIKSLDDQILKLQGDLRDASDDLNINSIKLQLENLESQRTKLVFPFSRQTFMGQVVKDELMVGLGQAAGYEIANFFDFDTDVGEVFGALSTALKVPQFLVKMPYSPIGGPIRGANNIMGGYAGNLVRIFEDLPFIKKGTFIDRRFDLLTDELQRSLDPKEKVAVEQVATIMKTLPPLQRELVYKSLTEYQGLRNRIVGAFKDPEKRERAKNLFQLSFGHVSGLAPLLALERKAAGKLKATGRNLEDAIDFQLQSENTVAAATEAINELKIMIADDFGIDVDDREVLTTFTNNFMDAADQFSLQVNETKIEYMSQLQALKNNILKNPDQPLPEDLITSLSDMEIKLTEGAATNIEKQREIYQNNILKVYEQLDKRASNVLSLKGTEKNKTRLGRLVEEVYDIHEDAKYLKGKMVYAPIDATGEEIDLSPVVSDLLGTKSELSGNELKTFFGAKGEFFRGKSGSYAMKAFNSMAERALKRDMGFDDDEILELKQYHSNPKLLGTDDADDYLEDVSPVFLAFHYMSKPDSKLKPFKGQMFEVEEMKRHFASLKRRYEDSNATLSKQYGDFESSIEDSLKSDPRYPELKDARSQYKSIHFDPVRKGRLGEKIDNARTGPADEEKGITGYKYPYKKGLEPENFHEEIGKSVEKIMGGDETAKRSLTRAMEELSLYWSAGDVIGKPGVFDVTTKEGKRKLRLISKMVTANIYEHWGTAKQSVIDKLVSQKKQGIEIGIKDYNFQQAENLERLKNSLTVQVKNGPDSNNIQTVQLVDLTKMINEEKDLMNLMELSTEARTTYKNLKTEIEDKSSLLRTRADAKAKIKENGSKELQRVANVRDSKDFFEIYIANGSPSLMTGLMESYVQTRLRGADIGDLEAGETSRAIFEDEFKEGVLYHTINGLLDRAGKGRSSQTLTGFDGKPFYLDEITNAGQLASDLADENTKAILRNVGLDNKHLQYLEDIGRYFEYAQGVSLARYDIVGGVRGISPNELISRAFNLARGMVSPTYVAGEMSARLLISKQQDLIAMAAQSKEASRIMVDMLSNPEALTTSDIKTFSVLLKEYLATEVSRMSLKIPSYLPTNELTAANIEAQEGLSFDKIFNDPDRKKQPLEQLYEEEKKSNENVQ